MCDVSLFCGPEVLSRCCLCAHEPWFDLVVEQKLYHVFDLVIEDGSSHLKKILLDFLCE